ncbi:MAG: BF3164 family lipoprotein [Cyclobacteriaceae bacterium]
MRTKIVILFLCASFSCTQEKAINFKSFKKVETQVKVDDILVRIPGDFLVLDNYFVLINPTDSDYALKVYDRNDGSFKFDAAIKGNGPLELIMPTTIWFRNGIEIFDIAGQKVISYAFDALNNAINPQGEYSLETDVFISKLISYSNSGYIVISDELHGVVNHLNSGGKSSFTVLDYPFENLSPSIVSNQFNGNIKFDPKGQFFAYAAFNTPFFSVHEIIGDSIHKLSSRFVMNPYYLISGGEFRWEEEKNINGFIDMTLGYNRLYLLHLNVLQIEANNRSISSIPNILYEFDFHGNPVARYSLDRRILRLAMSKEGELFGIALDEKDNKFKIVNIPI